LYVPGATVKDIVADLAHTDEFEDELLVGEKVEDAVWILCYSIASWRVNPRAGRHGSGRPSSSVDHMTCINTLESTRLTLGSLICVHMYRALLVYIYIIYIEREHRSLVYFVVPVCYLPVRMIRQLYPPLPVILMILSMYVD